MHMYVRLAMPCPCLPVLKQPQSNPPSAQSDNSSGANSTQLDHQKKTKRQIPSPKSKFQTQYPIPSQNACVIMKLPAKGKKKALFISHPS